GGIEQAHRHVACAVLAVEQLGGLDVLHVLAGRDLDAQVLLDHPVLRAGRRHEIDPHGIGRKRLARRQNVPLEPADVRGVLLRTIDNSMDYDHFVRSASLNSRRYLAQPGLARNPAAPAAFNEPNREAVAYRPARRNPASGASWDRRGTARSPSQPRPR